MTLATALAQTAILPGFLGFFLLLFGGIEDRTWAKVLGIALLVLTIGLITASIWVQV